MISDEKLESKEIYNLIMHKAKECVGEFGLAKANLRFLSDTWQNNKGIICINHKFVDEMKSILLMITNSKEKKITIKTIKCSGLINKLNKLVS